MSQDKWGHGLTLDESGTFNCSVGMHHPNVLSLAWHCPAGIAESTTENSILMAHEGVKGMRRVGVLSVKGSEHHKTHSSQTARMNEQEEIMRLFGRMNDNPKEEAADLARVLSENGDCAPCPECHYMSYDILTPAAQNAENRSSLNMKGSNSSLEH